MSLKKEKREILENKFPAARHVLIFHCQSLKTIGFACIITWKKL